jgi:hypothetical protein
MTLNLLYRSFRGSGNQKWLPSWEKPFQQLASLNSQTLGRAELRNFYLTSEYVHGECCKHLRGRLPDTRKTLGQELRIAVP